MRESELGEGKGREGGRARPGLEKGTKREKEPPSGVSHYLWKTSTQLQGLGPA